MKAIRLSAPMAGWVSSLESVPDSVFAERMMGDGIAIDPLDELLRAPCDGLVISVAPTAHCVTLGLANGAELLIHIGLETVALAGDGFEPLVAAGAKVRTGDPLIRFDLDLIARRAKSAVTPIVVASEGYRIYILAVDQGVAAGDPLMDVERIDQTEAAATAGAGSARREAVVSAAHGLHARPAARIAAALKPLRAEARILGRGRQANARSTVAMLALGLKQGDRVSIETSGEDCESAAAAVAALIEASEPEAYSAPPAPLAPAEAGPLFQGICASPGLAAGPVVQFEPADLSVPEQGAGLAHEASALDSAIDSVRGRMAESGGLAGEIADAHRALLDDPELLAAARDWIARGKSAAFAWRAATGAHAEAIRATGDPLLIERIDDLLDVERRLIGQMLGGEPPPVPAVPDGAILIAERLLPSQFVALDAARLGGIVTAEGGPTSHVAILAASAGLPMLVAAGRGVLGLPDGRIALLDAQAGRFDGDPESEEAERFAERIEAARAKRDSDARAAADPCVTADGRRIEIFANIASTADALQAVAMGAEGSGLLRTEFLFLDRAEPPSQEEQSRAYAEIAAALGGRPIVVRTLDSGGDKPVPYLAFGREDNPALGLRGVRISRARPDLLATQLRAILAGVPAGQCRIIVPMVVDRDDLRFVREAVTEAARTLGVSHKVKLGVTIETPAAALLASSIAAEADFLSVGTNDLTQYALAADRDNPALAARIDALHPAVLRLIAEAAKGAALHGRPLAICGDPAAAPILIGLGATELSATPASIPVLKAKVRTLRLDECRALAARALDCATAAEVRTLLEGET